MITDVINVANNGAGVADALKEAEYYAERRNFGKKEALRLRLLTEEMVGLVEGIVGDFSARFWIEGKGMDVQLMLEADTWVDLDKRDQLLSVSSSGKNYARRTFMGKLAGIFESCMMSYDETARYALQQESMYDMMPGFGYEKMWSLGAFRNDVNAHPGDANKKEEWDELEKSIVANLADEVIVGVKSHRVQLIIKKNFKN